MKRGGQKYIKAKSMELYFPPGFKLDNHEVGLYRVLRTGKPEVEKLPKEILGTAIECTMTPILEGKKVIGPITYSFSSEAKDRIDKNINRLSGYVENTNQYHKKHCSLEID